MSACAAMCSTSSVLFTNGPYWNKRKSGVEEFAGRMRSHGRNTTLERLLTVFGIKVSPNRLRTD
jgi:hypothetical protein